MNFGVITRVATPPKGGNLAMAQLYVKTGPESEANDFLGDWTHHTVATLSMRTPVFCVGEILILDGDGREVAGRGRKPSKWDVDVEHFDSLEDAVERAKELQR